MFKNRFFLLGIGIGFILSSFLLFSLYDFDNKMESVAYDNPSDLISIDGEKNDKSVSFIDSEDDNSEGPKIENNDENIINNSNEADINDSKNTNDNIINGNDNDNITNVNDNAITPIKFTIQEGMDSFEVADYLYEIGILQDKKQFIRILFNAKLTKKILAMDYVYDKELSVEELIELITNTNREDWQK
ncbi:hypothetical protein BHF71_00535 [Vulcanibacillus modesticaldus]|uniref:Endolytic transglycosylase MltG n=1 Tax=Vulcanibacillus modesticaldus TaxID=337097 RepID=A0A1D2YXM6_9BACI|nr:hypothetical protein [Vulcanibacillus modesticaldus]OEG00429.1 hypothetical protein BHF71_00535 [Vulcanibacillus modesticaldus]